MFWYYLKVLGVGSLCTSIESTAIRWLFFMLTLDNLAYAYTDTGTFKNCLNHFTVFFNIYF